MKKEYRNRLIMTGAILLGLIIFTLVDSYVRYSNDSQYNTEITEEVGNTEVE